MVLIVARSGRAVVASAKLDDTVSELVQVLGGVPGVDHQLGRLDDFANIVRTVIRQNDHAVVLGNLDGVARLGTMMARRLLMAGKS